MASQSQNEQTLGGKSPNVDVGFWNQLQYVMSQAFAGMQTCTLVRVVKVTNSGGVSPVGFVDVIPMVHMLDGDNKIVPHATIYGLPYSRLQGGKNAVIIDPEEGDIGLACFASRDITNVKNTKKDAAPGSYRRFDFADGVYVGGCLNSAPEQYIRFSGEGIEIHSPVAVKVSAPSITTQSETLTSTVTGAATITAATVTATAGGAATVAGATVAITGGSVVIGASGGTARPLATGDLLSWLDGHVHPGNNQPPTTTAPTSALTTATSAS